MRQFTLFSIFVLLLCGACTKDENYQPELATSVAQHSDYTLNLIRQLGCPDSLIQDVGDHFVADGDLVFPKKMPSAASLGNEPHPEQAYAHPTFLVDKKSQQLVRIWIDPSVKEFTAELLEAMRMWNNVSGHTIKFSLATQRASANVIVLSGHLYTPGALAEAQLPVAGYPGPVMTINGLLRIFRPMRAQKIATLAHEMGHLIGFGHTDWHTERPNVYDFLTIPGTPAGIDLRSLMCKGETMERYNTLSLSNYDKIAIQNLYPIAPYNLRIPASPGRRIYWNGPVHRVSHYKIWYQVRQDHRHGWQLFQTASTGTIVNIQGRNAHHNLFIPPCECTISRYWVQVKVKYVTVDGFESPWSRVFEQNIQ